MRQLRVTLEHYAGARDGARTPQLARAASTLGCATEGPREPLSFALHHGRPRTAHAKATFVRRRGRGSFLLPAAQTARNDRTLLLAYQCVVLHDEHAWISVRTGDRPAVQAVVRHDPSFTERRPHCQETYVPYPDACDVQVFQLTALGIGCNVAEIREAFRRLSPGLGAN